MTKGGQTMDTTEILKNIAQRCGGDIYLGIVGPVRVGKSTNLWKKPSFHTYMMNMKKPE